MGIIGFQVLRNDGDRQFIDLTEQGKDLGYRYYISLLPVDIDLDGDMDLIGQYWGKLDAKVCTQRWGSTIFINEGSMAFRIIEADEAFPELLPKTTACISPGLGVFFPTEITVDGMKGLFVAPNENSSAGKPELRVLRFQASGTVHHSKIKHYSKFCWSYN